jgi:hypothetical protein
MDKNIVNDVRDCISNSEGGCIVNEKIRDNTFIIECYTNNNITLIDEMVALLDKCAFEYEIKETSTGNIVVSIINDFGDESIKSRLDALESNFDKLESYLIDTESRVNEMESYMNYNYDTERDTISNKDYNISKIDNMRKELYDNLNNDIEMSDSRFFRLGICDLLLNLHEIRELLTK